MLTIKLKEATKTKHQNLERKSLPIIKAISSENPYLDWLKVNYHMVHSVETQIMKYDVPISFASRQKAHLLMADIKYFMQNEYIPVALERVVVSNSWEAVGAMYVLEGSALGAQVIAKIIKEKTNLHSGMSYLGVSRGETMTQWLSFSDHLNNLDTTPEIESQIILGANNVFDFFEEQMTIFYNL